MAAAKFHHFGVPTKAKIAGATYVEGAKVHITDPEKHPFRVEYVRFEKGNPFPKEVQTKSHAAFVVENLDEAVKGATVIFPPCQAGPNMRIAFVTEGDAVLELMEIK